MKFINLHKANVRKTWFQCVPPRLKIDCYSLTVDEKFSKTIGLLLTALRNCIYISTVDSIGEHINKKHPFTTSFFTLQSHTLMAFQKIAVPMLLVLLIAAIMAPQETEAGQCSSNALGVICKDQNGIVLLCDKCQCKVDDDGLCAFDITLLGDSHCQHGCDACVLCIFG